jgi:hypothetical protein
VHSQFPLIACFDRTAKQIDVLSDYDVVLALENSIIPVSISVDGRIAVPHVLAVSVFSSRHYVTEKLYDAMLSGSVPLYIGAPNVLIDGYINPDCGIFPAQFAEIQPDYAAKTFRMDHGAVVGRFVVSGQTVCLCTTARCMQQAGYSFGRRPCPAKYEGLQSCD